MILAFALDAFFISPILEKTEKDGDALDSLIQTVRARSAVVVPIVIALIALWVEIFTNLPVLWRGSFVQTS